MRYSWQQLSQTFENYLIQFHEKTESLVEGDEDLYKGLDPLALFSSLEDIRRIQTHPLVSGTWVDLGAGIGHSVLSYLQLHPERMAYGIEKSASRVSAGHKLFKKLAIPEAHLIEGDLLTADFSKGDVFFLYLSTGPVLDRILAELQKKTYFKLVAIESHGDLLARLDLEPGLQSIAEIELSAQRHHPKAKIFEKCVSSFQKLELLNRSFQNEFVIVNESGKEWIGETFGAEWIGQERFNLQTPARTILHREVKKFLQASELSSLTSFLVKLRREGAMEISAREGVLKEEIRKIYLSPSFCLELSGGQKVKWEDIKEITLKGHRCYDISSPSSFSLPAV